MQEVIIKGEYIALQQMLKFLGIIQSGGEAKVFFENHEIYYNGELEERKRKKLYPGDIIEIIGVGTYKICT